MSRCEHHLLDDPDGSPCIREEHLHNPGGHVYADGHGSDVPDRHDTTSWGEH